jgi:hypothetical protein
VCGTGSPAGRAPVILVLLALLSWPANAQDAGTDTGDADAPVPLEDLHETVKGQVRAAALAIDRFFSDEQHEAERNDSSLRLRFDADYGTSDSFGLRASPRLRLRLPGTRHRLMFEAESEHDTLDDQDKLSDEAALDDADDDDDGVELRLRYHHTVGRLLLTPEVGLGAGTGGPRAFASIRARR